MSNRLRTPPVKEPSVGLMLLLCTLSAIAALCLARRAVAAMAGLPPEAGDHGLRMSQPAIGPTIHIEDVNRSYTLYDAASGHPTADQLQHDYFDQGTAGLHPFAKTRRITGTSIAVAIDRSPALYSEARRCADILPNARERLAAAMHRLADLYPEAAFPPITIAVGHGRPVGTADREDRVMIGLEALCAVKYFDSNLGNRFVHVIAHEYIHVQQPTSLTNLRLGTVARLHQVGKQSCSRLLQVRKEAWQTTGVYRAQIAGCVQTVTTDAADSSSRRATQIIDSGPGRAPTFRYARRPAYRQTERGDCVG